MSFTGRSYFVLVLKSAIFGISTVHDAKDAVVSAINKYHQSLTSLTVKIGVTVGKGLLRQAANETKDKVPDWLFQGNVSQMHEAKNNERVKNSET